MPDSGALEGRLILDFEEAVVHGGECRGAMRAFIVAEGSGRVKASF